MNRYFGHGLEAVGNCGHSALLYVSLHGSRCQWHVQADPASSRNDRPIVRQTDRPTQSCFIVDGGRVECGRVCADHEHCTVLSPAAYAIQSTSSHSHRCRRQLYCGRTASCKQISQKLAPELLKHSVSARLSELNTLNLCLCIECRRPTVFRYTAAKLRSAETFVTRYV